MERWVEIGNDILSLSLMIVLFFTHVYLMKNKREGFDMFKLFLTEFENYFSKKIKRF